MCTDGVVGKETIGKTNGNVAFILKTVPKRKLSGSFDLKKDWKSTYSWEFVIPFKVFFGWQRNDKFWEEINNRLPLSIIVGAKTIVGINAFFSGNL